MGDAQIDLSVITAEITLPTPGETAKAEEESFERSWERLAIISLTQDLAERKKYARLIFRLACAWLSALMAIVLLQGFGGVYRVGQFRLSDSIILALFGTTTVNVIGTLYIVANYLFPKKLTVEERPRSSGNVHRVSS